ncbi:MAG: hypothetical protein ACLVGL_06590 [Waltera sp.]
MIKTTATADIYLVLILIFLYAPIATMMVLSFNAVRSRAKWGGFTTKWYAAAVCQNEQIMHALWNYPDDRWLVVCTDCHLSSVRRPAIAMQSMKLVPAVPSLWESPTFPC